MSTSIIPSEAFKLNEIPPLFHLREIACRACSLSQQKEGISCDGRTKLKLSEDALMLIANPNVANLMGLPSPSFGPVLSLRPPFLINDRNLLDLFMNDGTIVMYDTPVLADIFRRFVSKHFEILAEKSKAGAAFGATVGKASCSQSQECASSSSDQRRSTHVAPSSRVVANTPSLVGDLLLMHAAWPVNGGRLGTPLSLIG